MLYDDWNKNICDILQVILLQIYRLYVVHSETNKAKNGKAAKRIENKRNTEAKSSSHSRAKKARQKVKMADNDSRDMEIGNIAIISNPADIHRLSKKKNIKLR